MQHDHAPADWLASLFGACVSLWIWATDGMSPLSVLVALGSLALIAARLRESIARHRLMKEFGSVNKGLIHRIIDRIQTKPGDL
jgi:ABC-type phosphate transport system auxiliary subunit